MPHRGGASGVSGLGRLQAFPDSETGIFGAAGPSPDEAILGRLQAFPASTTSALRVRGPHRQRITGPRVGGPPALPVNAAVLCDFDDLDRAGRWCECSDPACPHAAYLTDLFPSVAAAREGARARAERFAERFLPAHRQAALEEHRLYVRWIKSATIFGYDYRNRACGIADAATQLRAGAGKEPAWCEIKRQRREEGADGALLGSPHTSDGSLFFYASALERVHVSDVLVDLTYPFE